MTRYLLTKAEQKELRAACNYMGLPFHAQAARPAIARQLIRRYQMGGLSCQPKRPDKEVQIMEKQYKYLHWGSNTHSSD